MYKRIISLAPSNTEILYALGLQDQIVATTRYCDYPPAAKEKPKVGGWLDIKDELVDKHEADVILTSTFVQDSITDHYKRKGLHVITVKPDTLQGVFESIVYLGNVFAKEREAQNIVDGMKLKLLKLQNRIGHIKKKPRLYCEEWHKPPTVSGNWVPALAAFAGAEYGLISEGTYSKEIPLGDIQKYNPEHIIVSICGLAENAKKEWISARPGWQKLAAVRKGNIHIIDDSLLNRPGPRLVDGAWKIAELVHSSKLQKPMIIE